MTERLSEEEIRLSHNDIKELDLVVLPVMAKNEMVFAGDSEHPDAHLTNAYWMLYRYLVEKELVDLREIKRRREK